jgi:uracil-DNA glycosylase
MDDALQGWPELKAELEQPYMKELSAFLKVERQSGRRWYPEPKNLFRALDLVSLPQVRVMIIGQDPYHGPGQAMGMSFSVPNELQPKPPSLQNIFKEIEAELGARPPQSDLTPWTEQGVLMLNACLSVRAGQAGSHHGKGWERFSDKAVDLVNERQEGVVFLLWGRPAQQKGARVDRTRHLVLESPHPSPLSAHRGFFGCGHFKLANDYLEGRGEQPIDWTMSELAEQSPSD